jgi:uncharacterized protein YndB with AHSA1/START domain
MSDDVATELSSIHVDEFLPFPPEKVWRALTDPEKLAVWLMPNDFEPTVGHRFTFRTAAVPDTEFDGVVYCEVLEIDPLRLLRISWAGGTTLRTTVTWRLVAEGRGTRLLLDHEGFDLNDPFQQIAHRFMDSGWRSNVLRRITTVLEELAEGETVV